MPDPSAPAISVIMPVYNGVPLLHRAIASLRRQSFTDWELLAVDDGSADGSADLLDQLAANDARIRVFRHPSNRGVSAARNTALAQARGWLIAYLDHDDEYYPDHLARAWDWRNQGDVLVFQYNQVEERLDRPDRGRVIAYDPALRFHLLFQETFAVPLAVVHRPELLDRAGRFDETLRRDVDGDLWRRFARAGARFTFVPARCGLYHIRSDSLSRTTPPAAVWTVAVGAEGDQHPLRVPAGEAWRAHQIFDRQEYGGLPLGQLLAPPVVLDMGANVGAFALYAKLFLHRDAVLHCFEPYPPSVALLRQNVAAFPGVTIHPFALGAADGQAQLLLHPSSSGAHSLKAERVPRPAGRLSVPVRNAGAVWDELGLGEVDVLKVDTEGCEVEILQALGARLERVRVVLAEFHRPADRQRIDALLAGHVLFGQTSHSAETGVVKYLRADLQSATADLPAGAPPLVQAADRVSGRAGRQRRLLFCSFHCLLDPASGAAVASRDLLQALASWGWQCRALCGPQLDGGHGEALAQVVADLRLPVEQRRRQVGGTEVALYHLALGEVPVSIYAGRADRRGDADDEESQVFLALAERTLAQLRPDVVLTYGGQALMPPLMAAARRHGTRVVFALHNLAYTDAGFFRWASGVLVPSRFAQGHYRRLGVDSTVLPHPLDWRRFHAPPQPGHYVTFVNPQPAKGVFWFARLALELGRCRPDIPLLVVEGRGATGWLDQTGLDLRGLRNLYRMASTPEPRDFYTVSRLLLMPSLADESFGLAAAEALANGIVVLASDRGALPEVLGGAGFVLGIPADYTPQTRQVATADEVRPWVETIVRLWDDAELYERERQRCVHAAQAWRPDQLATDYEAFFAGLLARG